MKHGRRLQNHPHALEIAYGATRALVLGLAPLFARIGFLRLDRWLRGIEAVVKRWVFDCRMCGQCILHSTGMTCPMTCPKDLRNGPCGGVRANGHCEVDALMPCIWLQAVDRSQQMVRHAAHLQLLQPPLDRRLEGSSAWVNMLGETHRQTPAGGVPYAPYADTGEMR